MFDSVNMFYAIFKTDDLSNLIIRLNLLVFAAFIVPWILKSFFFHLKLDKKLSVSLNLSQEWLEFILSIQFNH